MKKVMILVICFEAFKMYSVMLDRWKGWYGSVIVNSTEERPYAYRVLVPVMSRAVGEFIRENPERVMEFIFIISAVLAFWAMKYLYESFYEDGNVFAFVSFQFLFLICMVETKVYDYMTVATFSLSFAFMARGKHGAFLLLFPFATLNRETTFLLTLFYAIWFLGKIPKSQYFFSIAYQVSVYLIEKAIVQSVFSNNGGRPVYFELFQVISVYAKFWPALLLVAPVGYVIAKSWNKVPRFFQIAALTMIPAQILLHLLFGKAFEIRVFAESIPVLMIFLDRFIYFQKVKQSVLFPGFGSR